LKIKLLVLMTVLLGSYSRSWCQSEIDNIVHPLNKQIANITKTIKPIITPIKLSLFNFI
jgi:hypothetical protein